MPQFNKITDEVLREISDICEAATDPDIIEAYGRDETSDLFSLPEAVVRPTKAEQVSQLLKLASERLFPVTPRGTGTGVSGGAVPVEGGLVISLEKMDRLVEIDQENLMAVVEPGLITGEFQNQVEELGLFYPPDPASLDSCSLGGNVAEGAGGPRAFKYGITKDYVTGLELVLASGQTISLGGKIIKDVSGYNLIGTFIGSEGTLGIITSITLRLIPLPPCKVDLLVPFPSLEKAGETVSLLVEKGIVPATIEFMERAAIIASEKKINREVPFRDKAAQLLIEIDGQKKEELEGLYEIIGEICLDQGAEDVLVADNRPDQERMWEARREIPEGLALLSPIIDKEDVVVPRTQIATFLRAKEEMAKKYGVKIVCFGHAGDGNIHTNVLKGEMADEKWKKVRKAIDYELIRTVLSLGGTITGEHGIGAVKREYLKEFASPAALSLMRGIKQTFDPQGIMNPGKVL